MATSYIKSTNNLALRALTDVTVPFQLHLTGQQQPLICEKILRFVPKKRLTVFAHWGETQVVAKIFFSRTAKKNILHEVRGIEALHHAHINAPKILYAGTAADQNYVTVLILEKIQQAITLEEYWRSTASSTFLPVLHAVAACVAAQHNVGIVQKDLHCKNFLIQAKHIYTLDGGQINTCQAPLAKNKSLYFFALFLIQFGVSAESFYQELFNIYAKTRGWVVTSLDLNDLQNNMRKLYQQNKKSYLRKVLRNCTLFKKELMPNREAMFDRAYQSANLLNFIAHPESFFSQADTTILKAGRSATVIKIKMVQRIFVVKRYNIKNIGHRLRRSFRQTRAAVSWRRAQQLLWAGIPTAKPVTYLDVKQYGLRGVSYFMMEYIVGDHVGDYFADANIAMALKKNMAHKIIHLFKQLKAINLTHGDLKMTNILIQNDQPILIDLDGMKEYSHKNSLARAFTRDIQRFMQNWVAQPAVAALFKEVLIMEGVQLCN